MFKNIRYGRRQIFAGDLLTSHPVLEDESIVSSLAEMYRVGEQKKGD
jgi:hypothetical protein